ncbi:MAG: hypothetical protein ACREMB_17465 [Candidatus Rokuibacteriota bacterium]
MCDGRVLMEAGKVLTVDEAALLRESERLARRIVERAGLGHLARGRWPVV